MKYSLLVCAYNAEDYIKECLESLVNQNIDKTKFEVVLVNDGSKTKYGRFPNHVIYIDKKNNSLLSLKCL